MAQSFPFDDAKAYTGGPFNPYFNDNVPGERRGDADDDTRYLGEPGVAFFRPWLSVPKGLTFVWPLGIQGFRTTIDPELGVHAYIGDDEVFVDVMHRGQERISLTGRFPGLTGKEAFQALRTVVYADAPDSGKVLYLPHLYAYTQRVQVANATFDHGEEDGAHDLNYSIDFIRLGPGSRVKDPVLQQQVAQPKPAPKGVSASYFTVNSRYNTLRKIAAFKLKNANLWNRLYNANEKLFTKLKIPAHQAPNHILPLGTKVHL